MAKKTVVLIILDGWGVGRADPTNPIYIAQPANINHLKSRYLIGSLQASGIAVGLPWNEEGNSEVGHLTIGAGKTLYQHYPRITLAIKSGEFFKNQALTNAFNHASKNKSAVNLIGLLSEGNVHASLDHLTALINFPTKATARPPIKLHLFSDGKDSPPRSVNQLLERLNKLITDQPRIKIASLAGRYFAMDRDRHWDRTQEAYGALTGNKEVVIDLENYIKYQYQRELNDEFFPPICLGPGNNAIQNNDAVIFFNFREDSIRQITAPFTQKDFEVFPVAPLKNLFLATMTQYSDQFTAEVAFPPEEIINTLSKVLADNQKFQLRVAETEKYAHVTYFFNGLKDKPLANEFRILVPSKNIIRHDDHPEMMASEIANRIIQAIEEGQMDFILANFANPDIIAHTGNFRAAVAAIKTVDEQIGKIIKAALARRAVLVITADHGNIEQMVDPLTGAVETKHNINPVPIYLVGQGFEKSKDQKTIQLIENEPVGLLQDVAPTILELIGLAKPAEMNGQSLLNRLK